MNRRAFPGWAVLVVTGLLATAPVSAQLAASDFPDEPDKAMASAHEAFVKKVEGTVVVQILIDQHGRVAEARVVRSIPMLDEAALIAVRTWVFIPAFRGGQPVASIAMAPVTFRIY